MQYQSISILIHTRYVYIYYACRVCGIEGMFNSALVLCMCIGVVTIVVANWLSV